MLIVLLTDKEADKSKERQAVEDSEDVDMADQEVTVQPKVEIKEVRLRNVVVTYKSNG